MSEYEFDQIQKIPNQEVISTTSKNKSLLAELWDFLKVRKAWWLSPIIIMLLLIGLLVIFGQSSALSPFIYALF